MSLSRNQDNPTNTNHVIMNLLESKGELIPLPVDLRNLCMDYVNIDDLLNLYKLDFVLFSSYPMGDRFSNHRKYDEKTLKRYWQDYQNTCENLLQSAEMMRASIQTNLTHQRQELMEHEQRCPGMSGPCCGLSISLAGAALFTAVLGVVGWFSLGGCCCNPSYLCSTSSSSIACHGHAGGHSAYYCFSSECGGLLWKTATAMFGVGCLAGSWSPACQCYRKCQINLNKKKLEKIEDDALVDLNVLISQPRALLVEMAEQKNLGSSEVKSAPLEVSLSTTPLLASPPSLQALSSVSVSQSEVGLFASVTTAASLSTTHTTADDVPVSLNKSALDSISFTEYSYLTG